MSTYAELELRAKRRLGRKGFNITTEFLDEMIAAQEQLEKMGALPKFLRTTTGDFTTLKDATTPLVGIPPADFNRIYDDQALVYDDDDGNEKRAVRLDTRNQLISKKNAGITEGTIYWFQVSKTVIEIAPKLSRDTVFRLTYYKNDTVLTGSNENGWVANEPDQIMGMAGVELSTWLRDDRALQKFQQQAQSARRIMINQIEADEWGDTDLVMGDPD